MSRTDIVPDLVKVHSAQADRRAEKLRVERRQWPGSRSNQLSNQNAKLTALSPKQTPPGTQGGVGEVAANDRYSDCLADLVRHSGLRKHSRGRAHMHHGPEQSASKRRQ